MARWKMSRRGAPLVAAVLLTVVAGSCSSGGGPSGVGGPTNSGEAEDEVPAHAPSQLGGPLGGGRGVPVQSRATPELPQPFDAMNDQELVNYLGSLEYDMDKYSSQVMDADCVHAGASNKPCDPTEVARVFIEPEVGMTKRAYDAIPQFGLVVARIINYDPSDRRESTFGFPPSTRVWWVVDYDANHQLRSRFFKRNYHTTGPAVDTVGAPRGFYHCNHPDNPGHPTRAKFWTCAQSASLALAAPATQGDPVVAARRSGAATPVRLASLVPLPPLPVAELLQASWVNCGAGCCATSPQ